MGQYCQRVWSRFCQDMWLLSLCHIQWSIHWHYIGNNLWASVMGWGQTRAILLHMQGNDMILWKQDEEESRIILIQLYLVRFCHVSYSKLDKLLPTSSNNDQHRSAILSKSTYRTYSDIPQPFWSSSQLIRTLPIVLLFSPVTRALPMVGIT
jgi:hypothetical protein